MGLHHKTYLGRTSRGVGMGLETSQQTTNMTLVFQHQSVAQQCLAFAHKAELWPTKSKLYRKSACAGSSGGSDRTQMAECILAVPVACCVL